MLIRKAVYELNAGDKVGNRYVANWYRTQSGAYIVNFDDGSQEVYYVQSVLYVGGPFFCNKEESGK